MPFWMLSPAMSKVAIWNLILAVVAGCAIAIGLWQLSASSSDLVITRTEVGSTPVTVYRSEGGDPAPAVVIAHGFAGSQQLMQSFAISLARNGYVAVTFDFLGHGRNPEPLTGDITKETGATRALVDELGRIATFARGLEASDGRLALLGHSMASDIVVRRARLDPDVAATIAVSMFSPAVTATEPRNLLVIVGDWEAGLKGEALRAVGMAIDGEAVAGRTYGRFDDGTARRAAFSGHVEHIGVLYSEASLREAVSWLNQVFARPGEVLIDGRGPWLVLLVLGIVLLGRPLFGLLPRVADQPLGADLPLSRLLLVAIGPALLTPLCLRLVPISFLPVLVADYLAAHFALYGLLTAVGLGLAGGRAALAAALRVPPAAFLAATVGVALYSVVVLGLALDRFVMSFVPVPERWPLVLAMLAGTLLYFVADEWLTRGRSRTPGRYALTKLCFLVSLALAIGLDLERLFFLIIIAPAIVLFFMVFGLFSGWAFRRTWHPLVGGLANAIAFAWAIAATFPMLSG